MKDCPESPTITACGLKAAEHLVTGRLIVIEPDERQCPVKIGLEAMCIMEVLEPKSIGTDDMLNFARFSCLACGRTVKIADDCGELSATLEGEA